MKPNKTSAYTIIETQQELEEFARFLEKRRVIAVDLEADSMYHFREKVCLIQIATRKANVLIDPLELTDFSCLIPVFADPGIQKIFHGADYDIRSLHRDFGITVNNLFDTQMACRFLGVQSTGLEAVLQKRFDVTLDKKYQKKDWSQRPLPPDMLEYAARDAIYLIPLAEMLQKELRQNRRLNWVREECECLSRVRAANCEDEPLFMKFKGAGRMRPVNLAILEEVLQLRREIAEKKDRPLFKILGNEAILKIIQARPVTLHRLEQTRSLSRRQLSMYGRGMVKRIKNAIQLPEDRLPVYPRKKAPAVSPRVPERVKALKTWRDEQAEILNMDPALICNKSLMTAIAVHNPRTLRSLEELEEMKAWQRKAFGRAILDVLKQLEPGRGSDSGS